MYTRLMCANSGVWWQTKVGNSTVYAHMQVTSGPHAYNLIPQAARVTSACLKLRNTGPVIRSRPLQYINTPQLELDSYISFSNAITLQVREGANDSYYYLVLVGPGVTSLSIYVYSSLSISQS